MSLTTRRLLILVLLAGYLVLLFLFFYPTLAANCCGGTATSDNLSQTEDSVDKLLLASQWDTSGIYTNTEFAAFRDSLLSMQQDGKVLEITGFYYEGEAVPNDYESLGLARANQIRQLFGEGLSADQVKLSARPFPADSSLRTGYFLAGIVNWMESGTTIKEDVEVLDDRILIRFPYGSTRKVYNQQVDSYLKKLAAQLIESGDSVQLTGHTDNIGSAESNQKLGQERAEAIKVILVSYGVDANQISTESKGKTLPVDTNDTDEGRQNNRRVELVRIPSTN